MKREDAESRDFERRYLTHEVRMDEGNGRLIEGYASVTDTYTDMGWYLEKIDRGAFEGANVEPCACLHNHLDHLVVGRVSNQTLTLSMDGKGLRYQCDVAKTTAGNDLLELVGRKDVYQSSFGFSVKRQVWEIVDREALKGAVAEDVLDRVSYGGKVETRTIMEVRTLYDVSPVTFPAYEDTTVAKRCRDEALGETRQLGKDFTLRLLDDDLRLRQMAMRMTAA